MTENIQVKCLLDRYWSSATKEYCGTEKNGTLIDFSMQSAEEDSSRAIPVGIVILEDNSLVSVPVEFITKTTDI